MRLSLRHVEAFKATIEAGSVTGAAELLRVTQPAVSRLLADMDNAVGFQLFERKARGLAPTQDANLLYTEVTRSFVGLERIADVARAIKDHTVGSVRVISLPVYADTIVADVIGQFLKENPGITVELENAVRPSVVDGIASQLFDVGIATLPVSDSFIETKALFESKATLAVSIRDPLSKLDVVPLSALDGRRMVALPNNSPFFAAAQNVLRKAGVAPLIVGQARTQRALCRMVATGAGVALVDQSLVAENHGTELVFKPISPDIHWTACILLNSRMKPTTATLTFCNTLLAACKESSLTS
jgi:DNA-binding transcriptional LysR family regulator